MLRFTLFAILLLTVSLGCKKKSYLLEGRLMNYCGVPASNENLSFRVGGKQYGESFSLSTDADGYFKVVYASRKNQRLFLRNLMSEIPVGNIDIGEVYKDVIYSAVVSLSVNNPYTSADTLVLYGTKFPGPFQSGIIDTVVLALTQYDEELIEYGKTEYSGIVDYNIVSNGTNNWAKSERFNFEVCDGVNHEVELIID